MPARLSLFSYYLGSHVVKIHRCTIHVTSRKHNLAVDFFLVPWLLQSFCLPPIPQCSLGFRHRGYVVDTSVVIGHPTVGCFLHFDQLGALCDGFCLLQEASLRCTRATLTCSYKDKYLECSWDYTGLGSDTSRLSCRFCSLTSH